jgi:hypothetical protein
MAFDGEGKERRSLTLIQTRGITEWRKPNFTASESGGNFDDGVV